MYHAAPQDGQKKTPLLVSSKLTKSFSAWTVVLLTIVLSVFASRIVHQEEVSILRSAFWTRSSLAHAAILEHIGFHLGSVEAVAGLFEVDDSVQRKEFDNFVSSNLHLYRGIHGIEWVPRIPIEEREAFEQSVRDDGLPAFHLKQWQPDGKWKTNDEQWSNEYAPVHYVQVVNGKDRAIGIDLASNPTRRRALEKARDSNKPVATSAITLAHDSEPLVGFLLIVPTYEPGEVCDTVDQRRQHLKGFAVGAFHVRDIVNSVFSTRDDIGLQLRITDESPDSQPKVLFTSDGYTPSSNKYRRCVSAEIGGREWQFDWSYAPDYVADQVGWTSWLILLGGAALSALLGFVVNLYSGRADGIKALVDRRTMELRQANQELRIMQFAIDNSADAVFFIGPDSRFSYVNKKASLDLQYSREELCNLSVIDIDVDVTPEAWGPRWRQVVENVTERMEATCQRKDGSYIDYEITTYYVKSEENEFAIITARDVSELNRTRRELKDIGAVQKLAAALPQPVYLYDFEKRENVFSNRHVGLHLGYSVDELAAFGSTFEAEHLHPDDVPRVSDYLERIATEVPNTSLQLEYRMRHADGTFRTFLRSDAVFSRNDDGSVRQIVGSVTELDELQVLKRYALSLEQANDELEQFAYVASHDLQEPLRKVVSFCELLRKEYGDTIQGDGATYLEFAVDGASRMQKLIKDLLEFSRVGSRGQDAVEVPLQDGLDIALANLQVVIDETGATITSDDLPIVSADPTQLPQLLQNLIGNSIKYCERVPEIHVGAEENTNNYVISVEDNGIGVDSKYFGQIFGVFKRLHNRSRYPGTGIGLAICKRIVERWGGEIWVESTPDVGTKFFFSVPKSAPSPRQHRPDDTSPTTRARRHEPVDTSPTTAGELPVCYGPSLRHVASADRCI